VFLESHLPEPAGHEEGHGPALQGHRGSGGQPVSALHPEQALERRRHAPLAEDPAGLVLDHVHTPLAMGIEPDVACHWVALAFLGLRLDDPVVCR